jgi:hypothetical protein
MFKSYGHVQRRCFCKEVGSHAVIFVCLKFVIHYPLDLSLKSAYNPTNVSFPRKIHQGE